jgi:hypothetical protein
MCATHWRLVPRDVQGEVYAAWAGGEGAGTERHAAAIAAAIAATALSSYHAVSVTQPWATLLAHPDPARRRVAFKEFETRSWYTAHRGWLGIHAAAKLPEWARAIAQEEPFASALSSAGYTHPDELPLGALVGGARLTECLPTAHPRLDQITDIEREFGDFTEGRWAWRFADPRPFTPRPLSGALKLWRIPNHACKPPRERST